jgi:hypothetical protein
MVSIFASNASVSYYNSAFLTHLCCRFYRGNNTEYRSSYLEGLSGGFSTLLEGIPLHIHRFGHGMVLGIGADGSNLDDMAGESTHDPRPFSSKRLQRLGIAL